MDELTYNDGQQRLVTTMILISVIRDHCVARGAIDTTHKIENKYLFSRDRKTQESIPKFHLNTEDHQFFIDGT